MAPATKKGTRSAAVKQETIDHARNFLEELPEKPREDLSLREAVERMKEPLQAALNKGYSYTDLAKMLEEKGITISPFTLKNYVPSGKRSAPKTTMRKPRKSKGEEIAVTPAETAVAPTPAPEAAAPKTTSAAKGTKAATTTAAKSRTKSTSSTKEKPATTAKAKSTATRKPSTVKPTTKTSTTRKTTK